MTSDIDNRVRHVIEDRIARCQPHFGARAARRRDRVERQITSAGDVDIRGSCQRHNAGSIQLYILFGCGVCLSDAAGGGKDDVTRLDVHQFGDKIIKDAAIQRLQIHGARSGIHGAEANIAVTLCQDDVEQRPCCQLCIGAQIHVDPGFGNRICAQHPDRAGSRFQHHTVCNDIDACTVIGARAVEDIA